MGAFSNLKPHMDHAGTQPAGVGGGSHLGAGRLGQGFPRALTGLSRVGCRGLSRAVAGLSRTLTDFPGVPARVYVLSRVSHGLSRAARLPVGSGGLSQASRGLSRVVCVSTVYF